MHNFNNLQLSIGNAEKEVPGTFLQCVLMYNIRGIPDLSGVIRT